MIVGYFNGILGYMCRLAWLLLLTTVLAFSQPATIDPYWDHLITIDHISLPHLGRVNAVVRDERGFLWFGTSKGLCKYDGYQVRDFMNDPTGGRLITALFKSDDGRLQIVAWGGLWTFEPTTEQFSPSPVNALLPYRRINAFAKDDQGKIWLGTEASGLFKYDPRTSILEHYSTENGLSGNNVSCFLVDHSGRIWIGTRDGGLNVLDPGTTHIVQYRSNSQKSETVSSDIITSFHELSQPVNPQILLSIARYRLLVFVAEGTRGGCISDEVRQSREVTR